MPPAPHPKRPEAVALLRQGKPPAEIAKATGLSLDAIYKYARQERIALVRPPRPDSWTETGTAVAEALLGNPETPATEIAALYGVSGAYARQVRAGLSDGEERKDEESSE